VIRKSSYTDFELRNHADQGLTINVPDTGTNCTVAWTHADGSQSYLVMDIADFILFGEMLKGGKRKKRAL